MLFFSEFHKPVEVKKRNAYLGYCQQKAQSFCAQLRYKYWQNKDTGEVIIR